MERRREYTYVYGRTKKPTASQSSIFMIVNHIQMIVYTGNNEKLKS